MYRKGTGAKADGAHRKGVAQGGAPIERAVAHQNQRERARFRPHGLNMLARRELRWDGEGRRGRCDRLVEGSNECNDPKEDEGTEALGAVHRLAMEGRSSEHTLSQLVG
jgi:hypothetical protein